MTIRNESKIRTIAHLSILFLILIFFLGIFVAHASWYDGDDLGYLDLVTVNGTLFEDLDSREIVFYAEDLRDRDGQVEIKGILESERKDLKPSDLLVQISLNGGKSWQDAKGDSRWSYTFRPKIDSAYDLSIQVVRRDGRIEFFDDSPLGTYSTADRLTPYQLGDFVLHTGVAAVENRLNGEATLALGWLAQFVPDALKKPGTDELLLTVSDLEIDGTTIINGSVVFEPDFSFSYGDASFSLTNLTFTKDGASATGSLTLPTLVIPSAPEISFTHLNFSPTAINYTLPLVKATDPVQNFEILSGTYGVSLALSALSVNINTANQTPISLANLDGSILLGSGYGGITIPNLQLVENHISYGTKAVADAAAAAQTTASDVAGIAQNLDGKITIPNTDFCISNLGGSINLQDKSVTMSGAFDFPAEFGGGSVSLPADKPLILSASGISTAGQLVFDLGTPPTFSLSGFPLALSALVLNLNNNIPSGSLAGEVTLTNFGDVKLDMQADIDASGLSGLRVAAMPEGGTRSVDVGGFATLSLSSVVLSYENSSFEVELDGAITPTNDLLTSINGIGEQLVFTGLSIRPDAIALASDLEGWHDVTGASAGFEGAVVQLKKYGLGVDNNLFWLGLRGQASLGGSSASATAKIFHDGSTAIEGIDLTNIYFSLGDFFLKVGRDAIAEGGAIANNTQGYIGGLPQVLIDELPAGALNEAQELVVQLQNFQVDVAARSVSLGSVGYTPATPLNVTLGPATLTFAGISFTTSSASIDGSISLAGLGLPVSDLPFTDLYLGADGIAGEVDLIGDAGSRTINIMEGAYGFSLNLNALSVTVDTRKALANMVSLQTFSGGLVFGSGFNSLEIPDLELLVGNAISWGKNTATDAQGSLGRLTLPGDLFSLGNLGGSLDLEEKSLSIAGTLYLPPSMGSASLTIPPDRPLTLSIAAGLSTSGPLVFDPEDLPVLPLASIDTTLTALSLDVSHGNISGALAGDLNFSQFGGLQIAITAKIDKKGLQEFKIDSGNLDKSFDLKGFATLGLSKVSIGEKNENFYVEIDGNITPTHDLFKEYGKKIDFTGLRIFKTGIKFAGNLNDWHSAEDATFNVNAAKLSLKEYGLGVYHGALWFGLKGQATYLDNEMSLTAKIFQDGTYEISDFGFKGLYLALGDFSLRTSAEAIAGKISGAGSINAGFLTAYLPENLKDPLTGELQVEFSDLGVDLKNKTITSGRVTLPFRRPLTPNFGIFSAVIRSVSFGFDGASVDGDFSIEKLADIDLPKPPSGISFADIELSPDGFMGSASYRAKANPVKIPVLTGEYGIELLLSELTVAVDTTATNVLDKIRLTDLDGAIKLGSAYKMAAPVTQLRMLADKGITWGAASLTDLSEAAQKEAERLQSGLSFAIPGTSFNVDNLNGRLYLNDKRMAVWGKIQLPSDLGGGSVGITQANALVLSAAGVSTTGEVDVDLGSLGRDIKVAGFGADITSFSFGVTANTISGSIAGDIKLSMFDNLSIGVLVALGNKGISKLSVTADEINKPLTIGGFATLTLDAIAIGGGFGDEPFFVDLDGNLALENEAIADLPQTFDFDGLKIYKNALQLADAGLGGMRDIPNATIAINNSMSMLLSQYGFGVTDNRFWIALAGGVNIAGQEVTATAKLYHNSPHFELASFGADNLTIAIGDFSLRSSIAFSNEAGFEAEGGLHLGALMDAIPAEGYKNSLGELPVTIKNVQFDLSDLSNPKLLSGAIVFAPNAPIPLNTQYFNASVDGFEVGMAGGAPYGKVRGGTISFNAVGALPALEGVSITNLGLTGGGLQGSVNWSGSKTVHVFEDDNYGVDAVLTRISILFDSTQSEITKMFVLGGLDGSLAFGAGYKTSMAPAIDFLDGAYGFTAGAASKLTLPGTGIDLGNVSGSFDFAAGTVTVGGLIAIPYEETQIAFDVDALTFSSSGIAGAVTLESDVDLSDSLGFGALLTQASLEFNNSFALSAGSLGMELTLEKFFNLALTAHLTLDNDGVDEWGLGGETGQKFTADAGFANLELTRLGAGYESADGGLYFSMDTKVTMNEDAVLSALPDDLTLSGIEVYANTVKIDSASASSEVNYTVSLASVDLTLKEIGFGYVDGDGLFLSAAGDLNLASLAKIGTGFEVYENKVVFTKEMSLDIHKPAFDMGGTLVLDDDHFKAGLAVKVAGLFEGMEGLFEVGSEGEGAASFVYWQVQLKVPSRIPLSPLPLTVYSVGGGIAYHMLVTPSKGGVAFVANQGTLLTVTALVDIGSTDNGKSWYGEFSLSVDSNARVMLAGDSWIMEGRSPEVPAHIYGTIELGGSPAIFSLKAGLNFSKVVSDMDVVAANGQVDILFAQNDWHIYFGSKESPLSATVLHYLEGQGYLQIDRRGLAMGVKKEFNLKGSAWIFYGRLYGGAEVDLAAGVYPFYIDAKGKIWIGLEAGVHVAGDDYEIISAYAELGGQFKAPPIYIGLHGKARYSFLWGTISGTWDMTFTYPDNPPPGIADQGIESIPLIAYSLPEEGATEVSRVDSININTTIPIEEPFRYDDGNWYVLMVEKVQGSNSIAATSYVDLTDRQDAWDNALRLYMDMGTEAAPYSVAGGKIGTTKLQYTPQNILYGGGDFVYKARLTLCRWDGPEGHTAYSEEFDMAKVREEIKHEDLVVHFETTREDISFREGLFEVYPTSSTTPVYADTDIYMVSKAIRDGQNWNSLMQEANVDFQVVDAANQTIAGHVEGSLLTYDAQEGSMRYMNRFIPDAPLKPIRMVENGVTGVKLPAVVLADGSYQNPFTYEEPPVEEESAVTAVVGSGATSLGTQRTAKSRSAGATSLGTQRTAKSRSAGATSLGTQRAAKSRSAGATSLGTQRAAKSRSAGATSLGTQRAAKSRSAGATSLGTQRAAKSRSAGATSLGTQRAAKSRSAGATSLGTQRAAKSRSAGATSLGTQRAAKSRSAGATSLGTQRAAVSPLAGATPLGTQIVAVSPLAGATPLGIQTAAKSPLVEVEKDRLSGGIIFTDDAYPVPYHWYWSGEHVIQVVKNGAEQGKVYTSAFTIETPVEGEDAVPYDSTAEVISQSVSDPHFYVNYTVDQEAYRADIAHVRVGMVYDPIIDIFWANMAREPVQYPITVVDRSGNTHVEMHEQRVCGQFDSPNDLATVEGGEVAAMYPANWEDVRNLSKMAQWWIYTLALRGCASQEAELAAVQQQFDAYSEAAFVRHSVADFKTLEFRFTTQAPVNWNEVEFVVNVEPQFNGGLSFGQGGFLSNMAKAASSHVFGPDEYIIRSQTGSLEHRLELVPNDRDSFNGNTFVGWIEYHRSRGISLNNLGWVAMWERALEQNGSSDEGADQEYSLERGKPLYSTGSITTLRTSRPASSDRTDALQDANGNSIR